MLLRRLSPCLPEKALSVTTARGIVHPGGVFWEQDNFDITLYLQEGCEGVSAPRAEECTLAERVL